jgi:LacI family transcriptional regulator
VQNRVGARDLARALAGLGHRRLAVLAGPPELLTARDRRVGFVEGLREAGVADEVRIVPGAFTRDGGYAAAARLVADGLDVTCVFAVNDVMAVGAMAAFRDHGLAIPEDISVAGFDDIQTLRDLVPSLTTVGLPLEEMGEQAATLALDTEPGAGPRTLRVRGEVVLRASTRPVR